LPILLVDGVDSAFTDLAGIVVLAAGDLLLAGFFGAVLDPLFALFSATSTS